MSTINFQLTGNTTEVLTQDDLMLKINSHDYIKDIIYKPDSLKNTSFRRLKIANKTFFNVSFSKTDFINIDFTKCSFESCLFIGTTITGCNFQKCSFKNVNTYKIEIKKTYINPQIFESNYKATSNSNIAVQLFQQLLNNSQDNEQRGFARTANYNFLKWKGKLTYNKYKNSQPYSIDILELITDYVPNILYRFAFGYGLRLRNFLISFGTMFTIFFSINWLYWNKYVLLKKDLNIESFIPNKVNLKSDFFYTLDITTKIIDSQFQPSSNFGMFWLTIEGITGFIFFTALITILINKFVK